MKCYLTTRNGRSMRKVPVPLLEGILAFQVQELVEGPEEGPLIP
jgi:hypothetical protein